MSLQGCYEVEIVVTKAPIRSIDSEIVLCLVGGQAGEHFPFLHQLKDKENSMFLLRKTPQGCRGKEQSHGHTVVGPGWAPVELLCGAQPKVHTCSGSTPDFLCLSFLMC